MSYMNHVELMKKFINERLERGFNTFTHKDILNVTNANCPYSILRSLKKYYEIGYEDKTNLTKKLDLKGKTKYVNIKYRIYTIIKRKDKDVKELGVWRKSKNYQLPLIFMGESIN